MSDSYSRWADLLHHGAQRDMGAIERLPSLAGEVDRICIDLRRYLLPVR